LLNAERSYARIEACLLTVRYHVGVLESVTADYARRFAKLRTDKNRFRWSSATTNRAPHKPLLLLPVLDLFEQGMVETNLIELTSDLGELFSQYWVKVLPFGRRGNIVIPFFHMRSEGFWHLLPRTGKEEALNTTSQMRSLPQFREMIIGARLDETLYQLLCVREPRDLLRSVLIQTYFAPELQGLLVEQGAVNHESFLYSKKLLEQPEQQTLRETLAEEETYRPVARDQGFRRAVVIAYAHRCALCGVRVRTLDGRTVVAAAHIVPWSVGHDDRPANGMALCRTCHWVFDEGLLSVSLAYEIVASNELRVVDNLPGYLIGLEGRSIVRPLERVYWPDPESLGWHRKHVLRRG
jgi:putative restriction endonuclease